MTRPRKTRLTWRRCGDSRRLCATLEHEAAALRDAVASELQAARQVERDVVERLDERCTSALLGPRAALHEAAASVAAVRVVCVDSADCVGRLLLAAEGAAMAQRGGDPKRARCTNAELELRAMAEWPEGPLLRWLRVGMAAADALARRFDAKVVAL